jgi:TolA-binding protein
MNKRNKNKFSKNNANSNATATVEQLEDRVYELEQKVKQLEHEIESLKRTLNELDKLTGSSSSQVVPSTAPLQNVESTNGVEGYVTEANSRFLKSVRKGCLKECGNNEEATFMLYTADNVTGEFSYFGTSPERMRKEYVRREDFLADYCIMQGNPNVADLKDIQTLQKGKVRFRGDFWEVEQKATIKFV